MTDVNEQLALHARIAVESAADELGIPALTLARRLAGAEIARLVHLLNAATRHVDNAGLRRRIEDVLTAVTDGSMPSKEPESELDWALKVAGRRRAERTEEEISTEDPGS
jgi:hypothetical protein